MEFEDLRDNIHLPGDPLSHILNREGGLSQRASLTSSAVDLDLFVGKKVEVKGETNASTKTAWLLDVGSIKVIE